MIEHATLASFDVRLHLRDAKVVMEVFIDGRRLVSSRLTMTATQLKSPAQINTLIRRELTRRLGEVGAALTYDISALNATRYS